MKKLMFAIVAGLAITGYSIESANVVGYQDVKKIRSGKNFIGSTFVAVNGADTKIADFKPNADFEAMSDTVTLLNEFGGAVGSYQYMDAETAGDYKADYPEFASSFNEGWFDSDGLNNWDEESDPAVFFVGSTELYAGQTLMVQASSADAGIVFAGQVESKDSDLCTNEVTAKQKAFLCNCSPVKITFGQILPNDDFEAMSDTVSLLNEFGGVTGSYQYMDAGTAGDYKSDYPEFADKFVAGWWDTAGLNDWDEESDPSVFCINSQELMPGSGFMMQAKAIGAGVIIPTALPAK